VLTLFALGVLIVLLGFSVIGCFTAAVDRNARAEAWRRIAAERRWNHENIAKPSKPSDLP
jgi:hypothetical protein